MHVLLLLSFLLLRPWRQLLGHGILKGALPITCRTNSACSANANPHVVQVATALCGRNEAAAHQLHLPCKIGSVEFSNGVAAAFRCQPHALRQRLCNCRRLMWLLLQLLLVWVLVLHRLLLLAWSQSVQFELLRRMTGLLQHPRLLLLMSKRRLLSWWQHLKPRPLQQLHGFLLLLRCLLLLLLLQLPQCHGLVRELLQQALLLG